MAELAIKSREVSTRSRAAHRHDDVFFGGMAAVLAIVVFTGFVPGFHERMASSGTHMGALLAWHIVLYTAWMLLHPAQAMLAAARSRRWHRRLGWAGLAIAVAMVAVGIGVWAERTRRIVRDGSYATNVPVEDLTVALGLFDVLAFSVLLGAAIWFRRQPDTHRRLTVFATMAVIGPGVLLLPGVTALPAMVIVSLPMAPVVPLLAYDLMTRRRVLSATAWGTAVTVGYHVAGVVLAQSGGAGRIAGWLAR